MLQLKDDRGNDLPQEVQDRVNSFIDKLPTIPWFKPSKDLKKSDVEKQINFTLECFGIKAGIEYKTLKSEEDWSYAWDSAWDSARDSAWASAWACSEILVQDNEEFRNKYPNGTFKQLFKLWEMGLYPVGILKDTGKFTVYVPDIDLDTWGSGEEKLANDRMPKQGDIIQVRDCSDKGWIDDTFVAFFDGKAITTPGGDEFNIWNEWRFPEGFEEVTLKNGLTYEVQWNDDDELVLKLK